MKDNKACIWYIVSGIFILLIYRFWIIHPEIIGGDWPYLFKQNLLEQTLLPTLWTTGRGGGLGGLNIQMNLELFHSVLAVFLVQFLHLPWVFVYKVGWFGLFLVTGFFGAWRLLSKLFDHHLLHFERAIGVIIFMTNTYILMITSGGQMGIALAYATTPWVFVAFMSFLTKKLVSWRNSASSILFASLCLGVQILFDLRIAFITLCGIFLLIFLKVFRDLLQKSAGAVRPNIVIGIAVAVSIFFAVFMNLFWFVPTLIYKDDALAELGAGYASLASVKFFSFATFVDALSLRHPNWPDNIFGKVSFFQADFLILPFIVGIALLLFKKSFNKVNNYSTVPQIFFLFLTLLGAFLAKGTNQPFSGIFYYIYVHVPGFSMFRDPTKFFLLVCVAYMILIPISLSTIRKFFLSWIGNFSRNKLNISLINLVPVGCFLLYWIILIKPLAIDSPKGTFSVYHVPKEYFLWENYVSQQSNFFRVLWVPKQYRFGFGSINHPMVEAMNVLTASDSAQVVRKLQNPEVINVLQALMVKYIIVPIDVTNEVFLTDRKYDQKKRKAIEDNLDQIKWLNKKSFGSLGVYETNYQIAPRFAINTMSLPYVMISQSFYTVNIPSGSGGVVTFSERYHSGWRMKMNNIIILPTKSSYGMIEFQIPSSSTRQAEVYFEPEKYARIGYVVSFISISVLLLYYGLTTKRKMTL